MKFKNISKRTKQIKIDGNWISVLPEEEFEVLRTLGRLHLDPELEKVEGEDKLASPEVMKGRVDKLKKAEKEMMDVSGLDDKSKARVKDLKEDLKDDGKRNMSHKKPNSKAKPKGKPKK